MNKYINIIGYERAYILFRLGSYMRLGDRHATFVA
jgi:hypothetical protein